MAEIKVYRAAYVVGSDEDALVRFSGWVQASGQDEVVAEIESAGAGVSPTILGWEEKKLDTDPF